MISGSGELGISEGEVLGSAVDSGDVGEWFQGWLWSWKEGKGCWDSGWIWGMKWERFAGCWRLWTRWKGRGGRVAEFAEEERENRVLSGALRCSLSRGSKGVEGGVELRL